MMRGTSVSLVLHDRDGRATGVSILNNLGELAKPKAWSASPGARLTCGARSGENATFFTGAARLSEKNRPLWQNFNDSLNFFVA